MERLHFETRITAPKERVWHTMLDDATYQQWTRAFMEGSTFEGSWDEGSKILFLDPERSGMVAVIAENRPYEFISIKHIGILNKGIEDTESGEAKKWSPAFENYSFSEADGTTTVQIDVDVAQDYLKMFKDMWPKALDDLKQLAEK